MIVSVFISCVLFFFIYEWFRPDNSQDKSKPGKFYLTKYILFRMLLYVNASRQKKKQKSEVENDRTNRGYGSTVLNPVVLENCIPLEDHPFAIDTTYFNGFNKDGISVALRVARKPNREGEVWVFLNIPGVGYFQHPFHPDTGVVNMNGMSFTAAGCRFEMLEPLTRWRVSYNGLLRRGLCNNLDNKQEDYVHVRLAFKWECINDPFNFDTDCDQGLLADAIAREKWTTEFWKKLRGKHQTHYEQIGELCGNIEIEGYPGLSVRLLGWRDHTFGFRNWEMFHRYAIHFIWLQEIGMFAMVAVLWMPDYITFFKSGFVTYANGENIPVQDVNLDLFALTQNDFPLECYRFNFKAGNRHFQVEMRTTVTPVVYHYSTRRSRVLERFCEYTVNDQPGRGIVEYHYRNPDGPAMSITPPTSVPLLTELTSSEMESMRGEITVPFTDRACCSDVLVGGKASQLAFLTSIQDEVEGIVPRGFCVTLSAFQRQVQENSDIDQNIENICEAIRSRSSVEQIKKLCSNTVKLLAGCSVIQPIKTSVTYQLQLFNPEKEAVSFAVRSSAAGEDGGEASSAGQMETYLGIQGVEDILESIRKCWASAYTYQAVEYRRQHGQPIRTAVGVVIQEMVQSEVSGVLFTHDPMTGSPNKMIIDASYGLGEAVVSGKTTPDTYTVQRLYDNQLSITERHLGRKNVQIKVSDIARQILVYRHL